MQPQPPSSMSSVGMSVGLRAPGRWVSNRTSHTPMAAWLWASNYLTQNMRSSKWSKTPGAATCCSMARGPAMAPAQTDLRRGRHPTRCPWSSVPLLHQELKTCWKRVEPICMAGRLGGQLGPCCFLLLSAYGLYHIGASSDKRHFPIRDSTICDFSSQGERTLTLLMHLNA